MQEMWARTLGQEALLDEEMATHSNNLAWKISWTEEPGRLQSMGSQRAGHDRSDLAHMLGEDGKHILSWKGSAHSLLFYYEAFKEEAFMTQSGCPVFYYAQKNAATRQGNVCAISRS